MEEVNTKPKRKPGFLVRVSEKAHREFALRKAAGQGSVAQQIDALLFAEPEDDAA